MRKSGVRMGDPYKINIYRRTSISGTTFSGEMCLSGKIICAFFCPACRSSPIYENAVRREGVDRGTGCSVPRRSSRRAANGEVTARWRPSCKNARVDGCSVPRRGSKRAADGEVSAFCGASCESAWVRMGVPYLDGVYGGLLTEK
jgi:hypothetical protein